MDFYTLALGTITIWIILTLIDRWVRRRVQKKPDGHLAKFCDKFFHTEEENTPHYRAVGHQRQSVHVRIRGYRIWYFCVPPCRVPYRQVLPRTPACARW